MMVFKGKKSFIFGSIVKGMVYGMIFGPMLMMLGLISSRGRQSDLSFVLSLVIPVTFIPLFLILRNIVKIEITNDGILKYYRMGMLKHQLVLKDCSLKCEIKHRGRIVTNETIFMTGYTHDLNIYITEVTHAPTDFCLYCAPLGIEKFKKLLSLCSEYAKNCIEETS
jgi:hypothetical protein